MKTPIPLVILSLLLSVVIGWLVAHQGRAAPEGARRKSVLIGLSIDNLQNERWQRDRDYFVAKAGQLGAEVLVLSADSNDTRQVNDVEALISRGIDVLVMVPHAGDAMAQAVRLAHEANIPVIAYDRIITNCDLDLYMTFDNVRVGRLQAQYVVDHLPGRKIRLVRIYGGKNDNNALMFKKGQDEVLDPLISSGRVEVIHEDWAEGWTPENAKNIVSAAITLHGPNFDAVLASNDSTAAGAVQQLREDGLAGKVIVTGQDADLSACQRIVRGQQSMTVYKNLHLLAEKAAETAVLLARRRVVVARDTVWNGAREVPSILMPIQVVTKDNMRQTVIKDGMQSEEAVYGSRTP